MLYHISKVTLDYKNKTVKRHYSYVSKHSVIFQLVNSQQALFAKTNRSIPPIVTETIVEAVVTAIATVVVTIPTVVT